MLVFDGIGKKYGIPVILKFPGARSEVIVGATFVPGQTVQIPRMEITSRSDRGGMGHVRFVGMVNDLDPKLTPDLFDHKTPDPASSSVDLLRAACMTCGMEDS